MANLITTMLGMTPHHRYKLFRRMVSVPDKHPFAMTAWAVDLQHDGSFRKWWKDPEACGMSMAGLSNREYADALSYLRAHGAYHISRKRRFDDFLHKKHASMVLNLPDDATDLTYYENEIVVIGHVDMIAQALRWAKRYKARRHVVYTKDVPLKEIKQAVSNTNHRIIANTSDPGGYFVSSDQAEDLFVLWLRG